MKTILLSALAALFVFGLTYAENGSEKKSIKSVIEQFKLSGDKQNPDLANPVLHQDFALFYHGPDGWVKTSKEDYVNALKAKVIGGVERESDVKEIQISGGIATAHVRFESKEASFDQFVNLIKEESGWQIVSIALHFQPKG